MARLTADNPFELNKALNLNPLNTLLTLAQDKNIKKDNVLINAIRQLIENFKRFMRYNAYSMVKGVIPFANGKGEGVECGYYDYAKTADYQLKIGQLKTMLGISPLYDSPYIQEKYEVLKSIYPDASFKLANGEFHIVEKTAYTKEELKERKKQSLPKEKYRTDVKARLFVMNEDEYKEFRKSLLDLSNAGVTKDGKTIGAKDTFRPEMCIKEVNGQYVVNVDCPEVRAFVGKTLLARNIQSLPDPEKEREEKEPVKETAPEKNTTNPLENKQEVDAEVKSENITDEILHANGTKIFAEIRDAADGKETDTMYVYKGKFYVVGEKRLPDDSGTLAIVALASKEQLLERLNEVNKDADNLSLIEDAVKRDAEKYLTVQEEKEAPMPKKVTEMDFDAAVKKLGDGRIIEAPVFVCDAKNPNNYMEVSSSKETYEDGRPYVNTEFKVFKDGVQQECDEFSHKKFTHYTNLDGENTSAHGVDHWEKMRKEIQEKGGFSDKVIAFKSKERYEKYLEEFNKPKNEVEQTEPTPEVSNTPEVPDEPKKSGADLIYEHKRNGGDLKQYHFKDKESANLFEAKLNESEIPFKKLGALEDKIDYAVRDIDKEQIDKLLNPDKDVEIKKESVAEPAKEETPVVNEKPDITPDHEPFSKEHMTAQPELEVFKVDEIEIKNGCMKATVNGLECYLYDAGDARSFEVFDITKYVGNNKNVIIPSRIEFNGAVYSLENICPGAFEGKDVETIQINATGLEDMLSDKEALTEAFCLGRDIHGRPQFPTVYWTGLDETQYEVFKQDMVLAKKFLADFERTNAPERVVDVVPKAPVKDREKEKVQEKEPEIAKQKEPRTQSLTPLGKKKPNKGMDI